MPPATAEVESPIVYIRVEDEEDLCGLHDHLHGRLRAHLDGDIPAGEQDAVTIQWGGEWNPPERTARED